jgi:hypothetical protein
MARTYDVTGNVTSETQTLGGVSGAGKTVLAGSQTQSFTYDAAGRLTNSSFSGSITEARTYVYDASGNRTSVTEAGVTTYYAYDRTDKILWKGPNQNGSGSSAFGTTLRSISEPGGDRCRDAPSVYSLGQYPMFTK